MKLPSRFHQFRLVDRLIERVPSRKGNAIAVIDMLGGMGDLLLLRPFILELERDFERVLWVIAPEVRQAREVFLPDSETLLVSRHRVERDPFYRYAKIAWLRKQGLQRAILVAPWRVPLIQDSVLAYCGVEEKFAMPTTMMMSEKWRNAYRLLTETYTAVVEQPQQATWPPSRFDGGLAIVPHVIERYARLFEIATGRPFTPPLYDLRGLVAGKREGGLGPVVVFAGQTAPERTAPPGQLLTLVRLCIEAKRPVVVTTGRCQPEHRERLADAFARSGLAQLGNVTLDTETRSLPGLMSLISEACLFIGADTGVTHLAVHLAVPTLVFVQHPVNEDNSAPGLFWPYPDGTHLAPIHTCFFSPDSFLSEAAEAPYWQEARSLLRRVLDDGLQSMRR